MDQAVHTEPAFGVVTCLIFCNSSISLWSIFQKILLEDSCKHPSCRFVEPQNFSIVCYKAMIIGGLDQLIAPILVVQLHSQSKCGLIVCASDVLLDALCEGSNTVHNKQSHIIHTK